MAPIEPQPLKLDEGWLSDQWVDEFDSEVLRDYLAGTLSSEGFSDLVSDDNAPLTWWPQKGAPNAKYVKCYQGLPLDKWPCHERGHLLDNHAQRMGHDDRYTCQGCGIDFSEKSMYGSVLFDPESEAA